MNRSQCGKWVSDLYKISAIVGNTGFVGSNLCLSYSFNYAVHSTDVSEIYGLRPDLLIYAGVTGTKFFANHHPEKDLVCIESAIENIKRISPKKLVLISTVDVYDSPVFDENHIPSESSFGFYGNNRLMLECWVRENINDYCIIRLPAIYGTGLKKNFVYDLVHPAPMMLSEEKFFEEADEIQKLTDLYRNGADGYYYFAGSYKDEIEVFEKLDWNSLAYTDSRNEYQFYNTKWLWNDICFALKCSIDVLNISTEPIRAGELYTEIYGGVFENTILQDPLKYIMRSKYAYEYGRKDGFLRGKEEVKKDLKNFVINERRRLNAY